MWIFHAGLKRMRYLKFYIIMLLQSMVILYVCISIRKQVHLIAINLLKTYQNEKPF